MNTSEIILYYVIIILMTAMFSIIRKENIRQIILRFLLVLSFNTIFIIIFNLLT